MSWSARSVRALEVGEFGRRDLYTVSPPELGDLAAEQLEVGMRAARSIVDGGAVGYRQDRYTVTLSGHSNPGHRPADGYANDFVSVSVQQGAPPVVHAAEPEPAPEPAPPAPKPAPKPAARTPRGRS